MWPRSATEDRAAESERRAQWRAPYARMAEQGHIGAQAALGWLYARGLGIEPDLTFALFWLLVASAQGSVDAEIRRDQAVARVITQPCGDGTTGRC